MRKELDDLLCARYPAIFRDRHGSRQETGIGWGFECGDGWFAIIDELCAFIARRAEETGIDFRVSQVKEKTGSLRFRCLGHHDELVYDRIEAARERSMAICETCGESTLPAHSHPPVRPH
ncbi:hypothetical protein ETQ85_14370 [Zoogloea oleivorans]|jgi:hypothetical protein|uniref:Uncharacterized protein n=1 Tax=Zoogloea oleivorans TaxID=1552750 RepID=A0A6C2CNZ1_9RHOO|nr:hypothetical protein [Zoogloea oleivorans]TYC55203.1 hypothetical protein ETQ85_14370 [Zoogloea oleivorans]